jgi:WD40 repeat protein
MKWLRELFRPAAPEKTALRAADETLAATLVKPAAEPGTPPEAVPGAFPLAERLPAAYLLRQLLGEGGMGAVFLAHHREWDLDLVLKVPRPEILEDPAAAPRIRREAEAWTSLGLHPNIVYCYFVLPVDEVPVLVVEYLTGGNLRQWLRAGAGGLRQVLELALQVCHGMEHAHRAGLVHRDLKPENILLGADGACKVTDFGISLLDRAEAPPSPPGEGAMTVAGLGTRDYMPPEQWVDPHKVDSRADVFAFGVCLYEMLSGRRPYASTAGPRQEAPEPDRALPGALRALMKQCVDWYRDARPADFRSVRTVLHEVYRAEFGTASEFAEPATVAPEADGWNNRGVSYLELNRPEDALACFGRALEANPGHFEAARNRALLRWRRGEIDDTAVLLVLDQLAAQGGVEPRALALAGAEVHQERFDPEEARKALAAYPGLYEEHFAGREASRIGRMRSVAAHRPGLSPVLAVALDGRRAVTSNQHGEVKYWDADKLECLRSFAAPGRQVNRLAISPGGRWALLGWREAALECRDLLTGECARSIEEPGAFQAVALGPDAVFALGSASALKQWDLTSGECMRQLGGAQTAVACSLDGRLALSGGYDGKPTLWDLTRGERVAELAGHSRRVSSIALSADGRRGLSGSDDMTAVVWDLENARRLRTLAGHGQSVCAVAISADGRRGVSLSIDSRLRIWDLDTGRCVHTLGGTGALGAMALSADGRRCLTLGGTGELTLFELDFSRPYAAPLRPCRPLDLAAIRAAQSRRDAAIESASRRMAKRDWARAQEELLRAWADIGYAAERCLEELYGRLRREGRRHTAVAAHALFSAEGLGSNGNVVPVAVDAAGQRCLSTGENHLVKVWDVRTRQCLRSLTGGRAPIQAVALSADGRRAVAGGVDKAVRVWDVESGECLHVLEGHQTAVIAVALSPDGSACASSAAGAPVRIWDARCGTLRHVIESHTSNVLALAFSPDGRVVLSGSLDGTVKLTDMETGACLRSFERVGGPLQTLALLPGGQAVVFGDLQGGPALVELSSGAVARRMRGHASAMGALAVAADGRHAVSGGEDSALRVWDLAAGECLYTIPTPQPVARIALDAEASLVVAGHRGGLMSWWRLIWSMEFASHG